MVATTVLRVNQLAVAVPSQGGLAQVVRDVSFTIEKGQSLGLIGESGCGKSMTALAVMGLQPEHARVSGSILLNGSELLHKTDDDLCQLRGAKMAMIFQEPMTALNPVHTIGQQISESLELHKGLSKGDARLKVLELLERVQLPRARERLHAYPHELSGGQRQRVMIAIALACDPDLLIADEPTTALDVTVQREVLLLIKQLVREQDMGLLLISHDLGLMREQVDHVMVMYAGSVVERAPTQAIFTHRAHPYTQGLFSARPSLDMPRSARLPTIPGSVLNPLDPIVGCAFHARCPKAIPLCSQHVPILETAKFDATGVNHLVACPRWSSL